MKVSNVGSVNNGNIKKIKKSSGGDFSVHLNAGDAESSASGVGGVSSVNSLFMLQEVGDENESQKKALDNGFNMLEYLDKIRVELLNGRVSVETLKKLDGLIGKWREGFADPELESIIDDIELRAAVELAKLKTS